MESLINKTNPVWQRTIDTLQHELDQARDMPAWAIAVVVLCSVSTLCMLLVCGIGCGVLLQQSSSNVGRRVESERGLLASDSAAQQVDDSSAYDAESSPAAQAPKNRRKSKPTNRSNPDAVVDDMEL